MKRLIIITASLLIALTAGAQTIHIHQTNGGVLDIPSNEVEYINFTSFDEDEYNKAFGVRMASCADEVLLVGEKHTLPIREGLLQEGFPADRIHVFGSLNDAVKYLRSIEQPGDVVLYENDLPDNYA